MQRLIMSRTGRSIRRATMQRAARRGASLMAALLLATWAAAQAQDWPVIGRQGLVQLVLVPAEQVTDEAAYQAQISRLCVPERTCFVNFYTNSTGVTPTVPLPDAIAAEATAVYRRSVKNGAQVLTWSCRLQLPGRDCF